MQPAPASLNLFKYHILGNSYVVLPPERNPTIDRWLDEHHLADTREKVLQPDLVRRICSLDYGVGSSGLVFGPLPDHDGGPTLHIYNEDGSRCNFSGNAIRMLARYLVESGSISGAAGTKLRLGVIGRGEEKGAACTRLQCADIQIASDGGDEIKAALSTPRIGRDSIVIDPDAFRATGPQGGPDIWFTLPALESLGQSARPPKAWRSCAFVNVGNPHCITFVDTFADLPADDFSDLDRDSLIALSAAANAGHPLARIFPEGCNLQFAYVEEGGSRLHLRTFERGGGPTKSSGSSSSATAAAAYARGLVGPEVIVSMVGGNMTIHLEGKREKITGIGLGSAVTRIGAMQIQIESPAECL